MDFSERIGTLQKHVADANSAVQSAVTETRDKVQQRIDQAQVDTHLAVMEVKDRADDAASAARNRWAQLKADVARHMDEAQARRDKRSAEFNAQVAETDAILAEANASDAIDFAAWAIDNARLATLTAISARVTAIEMEAATARA